MTNPLDEFRDVPDFADDRAARIVQLALEGKSWKEVAADLGVTERWIWAIRQRCGLDAVIVQLRRQALESHLTGMVSLSRKAKLVIEAALDGVEVDSSQLDAAKHVSGSVLKMAHAAAKLLPANPQGRRGESIPDADIIDALSRRSKR